MKRVSFATGEDIQKTTNKALELEGNFESTFEGKKNILILINVVDSQNFESGTTTAPDVIKTVAKKLIDLNKDVTVCGGCWYGGKTDEAFRVLRLYDFADEVGFNLVDIKKSDFVIKKVENPLAFSEMKISSLAYNFDGIVNIPTLKTHRAADISLAMKSLMGFLHDSYKSRFHSKDLSKAIVDLNTLIKVDYNIIDGIYGKIGDEVYGGSFKFNSVLSSKDRYALDIVGANILGYEFENIPHLVHAKKSGHFSFDKDDIELIGDVKEYNETVSIPKEVKDKYQSLNIVEKDACCPCFASLIYGIERLTNEEIKKLKYVPIYVGQHVDRADKGFFIGQCTKKFKEQGVFIKGCPTKASDIYKALKGYVDSH